MSCFGKIRRCCLYAASSVAFFTGGEGDVSRNLWYLPIGAAINLQNNVYLKSNKSDKQECLPVLCRAASDCVI